MYAADLPPPSLRGLVAARLRRSDPRSVQDRRLEMERMGQELSALRTVHHSLRNVIDFVITVITVQQTQDVLAMIEELVTLREVCLRTLTVRSLCLIARRPGDGTVSARDPVGEEALVRVLSARGLRMRLMHKVASRRKTIDCSMIRWSRLGLRCWVLFNVCHNSEKECRCDRSGIPLLHVAFLSSLYASLPGLSGPVCVFMCVSFICPCLCLHLWSVLHPLFAGFAATSQSLLLPFNDSPSFIASCSSI